MAGVPFLVQAIVATEQATYPIKAAAGPNLSRAVSSLFQVAEGESLDGRIHACNILRALFRDNRLGEAVGEFVEQGVAMAIKGFKSAKWAVRTRVWRLTIVIKHLIVITRFGLGFLTVMTHDHCMVILL